MIEAQRLPDGSGPGPNIQRVLGDIPRYAGYVRGTPRKDVGVCAEKVDEHCFLFGVEPGTYKLAGGQGKVYSNAWNIRQLRRFYP